MERPRWIVLARRFIATRFAENAPSLRPCHAANLKAKRDLDDVVVIGIRRAREPRSKAPQF